jgi:hypothetical protein
VEKHENLRGRNDHVKQSVQTTNRSAKAAACIDFGTFSELLQRVLRAATFSMVQSTLLSVVAKGTSVTLLYSSKKMTLINSSGKFAYPSLLVAFLIHRDQIFSSVYVVSLRAATSFKKDTI